MAQPDTHFGNNAIRIASGVTKISNNDDVNYAQIAADGTETMGGTGRVNKYEWLSVGSIATHGPHTPSEQDLGIGKVLQFSDAAVNYEISTAKIKVPRDMDTSVQPKLIIGWSTSDNNGLKCRWEMNYLWRTAAEDMSAIAEGSVTDDYTDSVVAHGLNMTEIQLANLAATDACLIIQLARRSDVGGDTLNGINVDLHGVCLYYTASKLGA